jgi:hypothetical protein
MVNVCYSAHVTFFPNIEFLENLLHTLKIKEGDIMPHFALRLA